MQHFITCLQYRLNLTSVFFFSFQVSFVGVRNNSYLGDIGIDEISVSDAEECKSLGPKQGDVGRNPKEGEFAIYSSYGQLFFVKRCWITRPNSLIQSRQVVCCKILNISVASNTFSDKAACCFTSLWPQ